MRTVSFVDYFELDYQGSVYSKAMLTADVDNDNHNELVIGNVFGDLYIYRGFASEGKPWAKASDLGMITCLQVGDICNHGMNYLVTLSAEGWCHLFTIRPDTPVPQQEGDAGDDTKVLKAVFKQRLSANCKSLVIADIDGDGLNELVVAHTDRIVRAYRWTSCDDTPSSATGQAASGKSQANYKLTTIDKWILTGQIGSMTVSQSVSGRLSILVSQPGGAFVTLVPNASHNSSSGGENLTATKSDSSDSNGDSSSDSMLYHALGSVRARNPGVTTEVVGSISRVKKPCGREPKDQCSSTASAPCNYYSAICTLDGTITLLDEDKILWSLYVDHQLFALSKVDVTGDGMEEVVACSWDGQTYFINISKEVVRFHFRENVAAFCAGMYTLDRERGNVPCLFYATFNNKIFVYHNIHMAQIGTSNLLNTIQQMMSSESNSRVGCVLKSTANLQQLYRWCLYGDQELLQSESTD